MASSGWRNTIISGLNRVSVIRAAARILAVALLISVAGPGAVGDDSVQTDAASDLRNAQTPQGDADVIDSMLPGTTITVRPGDTVYGLSRLIYPHNEKAVHNLALAIVLANPGAFPDKALRPLRTGETLKIPDLREVKRIVTRSGLRSRAHARADIRGTDLADDPDTVRERVVNRNTSAETDNRDEMPIQRSVPRTQRSSPLSKSVSGARLPLQLDTRLDVSRQPAPESNPANKQQEYKRTVATRRDTALEGLSLRISRIQEMQSSLDARITRLERAAIDLREVLTRQLAFRADQRIATATAESQQTRESADNTVVTSTSSAPTPSPARNEPPRTAAEIRNTEPEKPQDARQPASRTSSATPPTPVKPPLPPSPQEARMSATIRIWQWATIGALGAAVLALLFVSIRKWHYGKALANQRTRIEAMLEQARSDASPLLGIEPAFPPQYDMDDDSGSETPARSTSSVSKSSANGERGYTPQKTTELDASRYHAQAKPGFGHLPNERNHDRDDFPLGAASEISPGLARELDDALVSTRTMFSEVDRYITLGRIQNATSLLEFQIKRNSDDRASWIKLLAIYRQHGMTDEFERTLANMREHFGDA